MVLSFKKVFPWGENTLFVDKILSCPANEMAFLFDLTPKIHTFREGQRWKAGMILHMATGVRSKNYDQFNRNIPELQFCKGTQRLDITFRSKDVVAIYIDKKLKYCKNRDHVFEIEPGWMDQFAKNDGFNDTEHFFRWFKKPVRRGQIIHWTDLKY